MERLWGGVAEAYARSFAGMCAGGIAPLLEGIEAGATMADVGCGPGLLSEQALALGADVSACDVDAEMVAMTNSRCGPIAVTAGLPHLPYAADSFEVTVANFVINHVDDPALAAAELRRVTRLGGSVRVTLWGDGPSAQGELFRAVLAASDAVDPPFTKLPADKDFPRTLEGVSALFEAAGCRVERAEVLDWEWRVHPDDFWAAPTGGVAGLGVAWRAQTVEVRERMRVEFDRLRAPLMSGDRMLLPCRALMVWATA